MRLIHLEPVRQRLQRWFHGVPAELFFNPPAALRSYFADEHQRLRPCTAHMLATGFVLLGTAPVVDELLAEARMWLARPPQVDAATLTQRRYFAADQLDNARDLKERDPANARLLLDRVVYDMLEYVFWAEPRMLPRQKALLATLTELAPERQPLFDAICKRGMVQMHLRWPTRLPTAHWALTASSNGPRPGRRFLETRRN